MIKIGLVNIDVSHPKMFSRYLAKGNRMRYAAVYNDGFRGEDEVNAFVEKAGVDKVCSTIEELVEYADIGFVQGCNWDKHLGYAMAFINAGKPVFIDKPIVGSLADCNKLMELQAKGAKIVGSSSVRYCPEVVEFVNMPAEEKGKLLHASITVGVDEFNYAIHAVEGICGLAQSDPVSTTFVGKTEIDGQSYENYFVRFANGATASYHCVKPRFMLFHAAIMTTTKDYSFTINNDNLYGSLLDQIANYMEGKDNIIASMKEITDAVKILLAGKKSKDEGCGEVLINDENLADVRFDGDAFEEGYRVGPMSAKIYLQD